ncbi:MAG: FAD-dependent oxidoreductase [Anaerolineales bacterium]
MKEVRYELAVVGGGPAGMEAAITAAEAGVSTVLIDRYPQPGGQYYKELPAEFSARHRTKVEAEGDMLIRLLGGVEITRYFGTLVWGIFPKEGEKGWLIALTGNESPRLITADSVILATGAYDLPMPFPGWTLPGVISAGAALILVKIQRILPGKRVLVTGSGPLLLSVAAHLIEGGAEVVEICEASKPFWKVIPYIPAILGQTNRIEEGFKYFSTILRAKTPYRIGWSVVEARGNGKVEEAVIARLDNHLNPVPSSRRTVKVDTIISGYGLVPNNYLSRMMGCKHTYVVEKGGIVPERDETMQTSLPSVYVVGDAGGIGGAELARLEGRVAGVAVASRLGRLGHSTAQWEYGKLRSLLRRQQRFAEMLGKVFVRGSDLFNLSTDETTICRCEEITRREIRAAIEMGARSVAEVKMLTRTGMGNCQGRMCEHSVRNAVMAFTGQSDLDIDKGGSYSIRPPLEPMTVEELARAAQELNFSE